jgi:hypothetical protein
VVEVVAENKVVAVYVGFWGEGEGYTIGVFGF